MKLKIGITGQEGFIGHHLYLQLGLFPELYERVPFERSFFTDENLLANFVQQCDTIVHLAALNRHNDSEIIYKTNIELVQKLIQALTVTQHNAHVLFSSSLQEEQDNVYGKSKREGRELLIQWAKSTGSTFTGMVIPNVFGPFGHPYYNSFIATFSHQLTHYEQPNISVNGVVRMIYVQDLVKEMIRLISQRSSQHLLTIPFTEEQKVSDILNLLTTYKDQYFINGIIPQLSSIFEINLFNTFRSYIDHKNHFPVKFKQHVDSRGAFVEVIRLQVGGQISFSTTLPGITRGNHYHSRKIERFAVIKGKALIQLRKIGTTSVLDFYLDGDDPAYVDMPIWYTHNIKNIGNEELYTIFWINEFYDAADPDTYFETVISD